MWRWKDTCIPPELLWVSNRVWLMICGKRGEKKKKVWSLLLILNIENETGLYMPYACLMYIIWFFFTYFLYKLPKHVGWFDAIWEGFKHDDVLKILIDWDDNRYILITDFRTSLNLKTRFQFHELLSLKQNLLCMCTILEELMLQPRDNNKYVYISWLDCYLSLPLSIIYPSLNQFRYCSCRAHQILRI